MKKTLLAVGALFLMGILFAFTLPANWKIADKYSIAFATSGVSGIFKNFSGSLVFDEQQLSTCRFDISIDVNSLNTGNGMQNKHAKSADWFDAARYPAIRFTSRKITKTSTGYSALGDLQVHGISKEVILPFVFKRTATGGSFEGSFNINRSDFKIGEPGGEVGEQIKVNVAVPVIK